MATRGDNVDGNKGITVELHVQVMEGVQSALIFPVHDLLIYLAFSNNIVLQI